MVIRNKFKKKINPGKLLLNWTQRRVININEQNFPGKERINYTIKKGGAEPRLKYLQINYNSGIRLKFLNPISYLDAPAENRRKLSFKKEAN